MQGIQPSNLSDEELVRYSYLFGTDKLPADWVAELLKRLEAKIDDGR